MSDLKEYVVTALNYEILDDLCSDIESPNGNLYIPNRAVEVADLRPLSRNTHYYLTDEEAEQLRQDPRVIAVERLPRELGVEVVRLWTQTGNFEKSLTIDTNDKNWGLLRVTAGSNLTNWGTNGSFTQTASTITAPFSGKNVDVVVVDAHINPNHPEFAVNSDGTGGSRVNQFDWFTLSGIVGISTSGAYSYTNISSNHGTHVAGTVAGNTQGWARDANIYHMEFSYAGANSPSSWELRIFDYLRAFHKNKPINPTTGRRNPTVTNHSWGYSYNPINLTGISSVNYRGVITAVSGTDPQKKTILENNGVPVPGNTYLYATPYTYPALNADVQDAIADGVIVVAAAGNSYWPIGTPTSTDYNNYVISSGQTISHSRGMSPGNAPGVICVGAAGVQTQEYKTNFSNFGSRIDIYAPGENIVSAVYDTTAASEFGITLANDPRNSVYKIGSISGTSMASPQVCGYIASLAETYQNLTQAEALAYIIAHATTNQLGTTGSVNQSLYQSLGDSSNNRYLFYYIDRQSSGNVFPTAIRKTRPSSGSVFPRTRIRYGS
jgi:hypothetical protein